MPRTLQDRSTRGAVSCPGDEINNRLFFRLFQAANLYERQAQRVLLVSAVQGAILGALSRDAGRGMPLSELVDYLAVSRQNLDGVLKRLEKLGYVERVEDAENRRQRIVRLTPAGLRAWRDLFARSLRFYRLGTEGMPASMKIGLAEGLGRLNRALGAIDAITASGPRSRVRAELAPTRPTRRSASGKTTLDESTG